MCDYPNQVFEEEGLSTKVQYNKEIKMILRVEIPKTKQVLECTGGFTLEGCFLGFKVVFYPPANIWQRSPFTCDNPRWALPPWKSIYALIHLPVAACVRQCMKTLDRWVVSHCPPPTLPFCYLISVERLCVMGSPRSPTPHCSIPSRFWIGTGIGN